MQLSEYLPYDVRDVMRALPADGDLRHKFRNFTLNPRVGNRARSVRDFVEDLGFCVRELALPGGMNGRLVHDTWSESGYAIEVNEAISVQAKRFATLHELAHFYLDTDSTDPFEGPQHFDLSGSAFYLDPRLEQRANAFAEALLFGAGQLAAAHGLCGGNVKKLAHYFGVTERVVAIAISKLKEQGGADV